MDAPSQAVASVCNTGHANRGKLAGCSHGWGAECYTAGIDLELGKAMAAVASNLYMAERIQASGARRECGKMVE